MTKNLVIVESPAKARTINKYLGKDFVVKASMGHVRDLPKGKLGIDVENDFATDYSLIKTRADTVKELRKAAKSAEAIYLAPDPDREGEAIAWHLIHALDIPEEKTFRITFNEITKRAVKAALEQPGKVNYGLVNAQQARRILDRLVGYKLSPLLWEKIARGLSAGRVQSVAVRLIVERELEIRAFIAEEYWKVTAHVSQAGLVTAPDPLPVKESEDEAEWYEDHDDIFTAELKRKDGKALELANGEDTHAAVAIIESNDLIVSSVEKKKKSVKAPPPHTTSLLQQQASTRLRFTAKRTMRVAQQLYEGINIGKGEQVGLITYMRTDSFRLADEAVTGTREFIERTYGDKYVPEKPNSYAAKKGAQEGHEAIRPTDIRLTPSDLKEHLTSEQYRLYKLIWDRVVASQMESAIFDQTSVTIDAGPYTFTTRGRALVFDGHLKVSGVDKAANEQDLPALKEGEKLDSWKIAPTQHFTQPSTRYSEATLVKALEKNGIGRPSTYASILSTIQDRGYAKLTERKFFATELGEIVNESLVKHFPDIFDYEFTAGMESKLDLIEESKAEWLKVVSDFYDMFAKDLDEASENMVNLKVQDDPEGRKCEDCSEPMLLRMNRYGRFLGCSGYPACKSVLRIGADGKAEDKRPAPEPTDEICDKCGKEMVIRAGKRGRFMACTGWPKCKNTFSVDEEGNPIKPKTVEEQCPKCEGTEMVVRFSKRGPFLGCTRYPKCRGTKQLSDLMKAELAAEKAAKEAAQEALDAESSVEEE